MLRRDRGSLLCAGQLSARPYSAVGGWRLDGLGGGGRRTPTCGDFSRHPTGDPPDGIGLEFVHMQGGPRRRPGHRAGPISKPRAGSDPGHHTEGRGGPTL